MATFESGGVTIYHNSDFSGDVVIKLGGGIRTTLKSILFAATSRSTRPRFMLRDAYGDPTYVPLIVVQAFVAKAVRANAIAALEQMDDKELLSNSFAVDITRQISSSPAPLASKV